MNAAFPLIGNASLMRFAAATGDDGGNFSPALAHDLSLVRRAKAI